ncbi:MAG TPA: alpha-galactosidase [Clostridia bacterium]|jgi:alpha-galactosidase|nr:alpha-galactosidase [Clostridia bacterium]
MKECKLFIKYKVDGKLFSDDNYQNQHYVIEKSFSDNMVKLDIIPKAEIELVALELSYNYEYDPESRFYINGYQSWTTSYEARSDDRQRGITPILKAIPFGKLLAATSGDYSFVDYPSKAGMFHSFTYTYITKDSSDELCFYGSLNEKTGYTIFHADMNSNKLKVVKDVEGVIISKPYELLNIIRIEGLYDGVFDKYFAALNISKPSKIDHLAGYTSWYNYFGTIDEKIILRDLDGLDRVKDVVNIFQIDDGYQPFIGEWTSKNEEKFPIGMKKIAEKVHKKGYLAGIWLAPFNVQRKSKLVKEHPDWFIKNEKGKPIIGCVGWGGAYVLDIEIKAVREYIKNFFDVIANDWNFDMFKLDFLYSQCMLPRNGKSRGQIMCEAMEFLRECAGEKLILGCGVPLGPAFGLVDACRIGCDMDLQYKPRFYNKLHVNNEIPSVQNSMTNTISRRHLNGRVFLNDPDVFFFRDTNLKFTLEQKKILAKVNNLFGSVLFVSENVADYGDDALALAKKAFAKSNAMIISVTCDEDKCYTIKYLQDGEQKKFSFDLKTGTEL